MKNYNSTSYRYFLIQGALILFFIGVLINHGLNNQNKPKIIESGYYTSMTPFDARQRQFELTEQNIKQVAANLGIALTDLEIKAFRESFIFFYPDPVVTDETVNTLWLYEQAQYINSILSDSVFPLGK